MSQMSKFKDGNSPFYNKDSMNMFQEHWLPPCEVLEDMKTVHLNTDGPRASITSTVKISAAAEQSKMCSDLELNDHYSSTAPVNEVMIIEIFPTFLQKNFFDMCIAANIYIYNKTANYFRQLAKTRQEASILARRGCIYKNCRKPLHKDFCCREHKDYNKQFYANKNLVALATQIGISNASLNEDELWFKSMPFEARFLVMKEFVTTFREMKRSLKMKRQNDPVIQDKSHTDSQQHFHLDAASLTDEVVMWPNNLQEKLRMRSPDWLWLRTYLKKFSLTNRCKPNETKKRSYMRKDMRVVREANGKYFLVIPYARHIMESNGPHAKPHNIVSIDPGVRSFNTFYDPEGICGKLGEGLSSRVEKIRNKIIKLQNVIQNSKNNPEFKNGRRIRKKLNIRITRLETKMKNVIDDYHNKYSKFYCKNYETIVIPQLNTEDAPPRVKDLAHDKFIDKLSEKAVKYRRNVVIADESFTTKTCGACGKLNSRCYKSVLKCEFCGIVLDRDINGARNILIKHQVEQQVSS